MNNITSQTTTPSRLAQTEKWLPGVRALRTYQRPWLPRDLVAGLVLCTLLVPQGMAYAELAGLPAITGLYTTVVCLVAYAIVGPSPFLVLGPDSSLGPMIAATILPLAAGDTNQAIALAGMLALMVGLINVSAGLAKLGFVADLLSKPVRVGYLTGLSITIFIGQLPNSTSAGFAARRGYDVNSNQELVGIGSANLLAGLFQGFPVSTSSSRTAVAEQSGAKSQLTGLAAAALVLVMLLFIPGLVKDMPQPVLAAVVISASISLFDLAELRRLWSIRKGEFWLALACILGVAFVGVLQGIVIAVVLSILQFFQRAWQPYSAVLGKPEEVDGYHDLKRYPQARQIPGLLILRWDAPLFFANTNLFREWVRDLIKQTTPTPVWIVIAAEPITEVDTTAADMLVDLDEELNAANIHLIFAELKDPVKDKMIRYGLLETIDRRHFYPTLEAAIEAFHQEFSLTGLHPEG
jgi:MFS superfamily sulfate permease-like transporter